MGTVQNKQKNNGENTNGQSEDTKETYKQTNVNGKKPSPNANNNDSAEKSKSQAPPELQYTFTVNGKTLKDLEEEEWKQDNDSDQLLTTEIREGVTPMLEENDEDDGDNFNDNNQNINDIIDSKDISLADLGDGMIFSTGGGGNGLQRKQTLKKVATLKKTSTLKKKLEQKAIIQVSSINTTTSYFETEFARQATRKQSHKQFNKAITLFVPQN